MASDEKTADDKSATRAEYQVALEAAKAALETMKEKRDDPATSEDMRALYRAESERLEAQIKEMEDALEDYLSPEKLAERETAREQAWGKEMMNAFREGFPPAASWLERIRSNVGDRAWLFEDAELEADGYEKFTTPEGKTAWRKKKKKKPDS